MIRTDALEIRSVMVGLFISTEMRRASADLAARWGDDVYM